MEIVKAVCSQCKFKRHFYVMNGFIVSEKGHQTIIHSFKHKHIIIIDNVKCIATDEHHLIAIGDD